MVQIKKAIQGALRRAGYNLHRMTDEEKALFARIKRENACSVESVFGDALARLAELRSRYAQVRLPVSTHSLWAARDTDKAGADIGYGGVDLRRFRAAAAYVWDYVDSNVQVGRLRYHLYCEAVCAADPLRLLSRLKEDGAFGCFTYEHPAVGRVSRDLLDSVVELNFLQRHLQIFERSDLRVLDIGAGYGRMAHRMLEAHPGLATYACVDAVAESTFLCEFYLRHRNLSSRADVIALDELEARLDGRRFDLALNIHSFAECTYVAIEWWMQKLAALGVRHLLIVNNDPLRFLSTETDRSKRDYSPLLQAQGFALKVREPVFAQPAVQELMGVRDSLCLFERA